MSLRSSLSPMLPLLVPTVLLVSASAAPAAGNGYYRATFAEPVARTQLIAKELLWSCAGDACTAAASNSRPAIVCSTLARSVGPLLAFSAGGVPFDTAALQKCNSAAS